MTMPENSSISDSAQEEAFDKKVSSIIGKDTVDSMRGGILFGFGAMCDGLVAKYRKTLGKGLKVIATGGNCNLMKKYARCIMVADGELTLKGIYLIKRNSAQVKPG